MKFLLFKTDNLFFNLQINTPTVFQKRIKLSYTMLTIKKICSRSLKLTRAVKSSNTQINVPQKNMADNSRVLYFHSTSRILSEENQKVLKNIDNFVERHLGPDEKERQQMLEHMNLKVNSIESLFRKFN